jgi:hypothetical protein
MLHHKESEVYGNITALCAHHTINFWTNWSVFIQDLACLYLLNGVQELQWLKSGVYVIGEVIPYGVRVYLHSIDPS